MKESFKNNNMKNATPVMKQFWEAKASYPNSIMLFRMGDFYETFDNDAKLASKILGITLTKRSNGAASSVPLAGFPYHSLDQHLYKFLKSGYRVAICEQVEDPKLSKGIVKREVVEVLSPGTAIAEKYLSHKENNFLCSIFIHQDDFGYAVLDYSTGEFSVGENKISELSNILNQYNTTEIIIPKNQLNQINSRVSSNILITEYHNWISDKVLCYDKLLDHFSTKSLKGFGLNKNNLGVIASGSALIYVEENYFGKIKHITSLSKITNNDSMCIDASTIKNLEIFESLSSKNNKGTLIDVIDSTSTAMGSRLLKQHLAKPLLSKKKIDYRLKLVDEFIKNYINDDSILNELQSMCDIPRVISKISTDKSNPKDLIDLSNALSSILRVKKSISKNRVIHKLFKETGNIKKICNKIDKNIIPDPPVKLNKGGFIKSGISKDLDKLRKISNNANQWLLDYQEEQKKNTNIPSLKISYNKVFGYYIDITKTHIDKVPDNYIRKQTLTNSERYFTEELKEYENKILSSSDEIVIIENKIYSDVITYILKYVHLIQNNANIIGKFDVITSHALTAINNNYKKPTISQKSSKFKLKKSRHPVVEKLLPLNEKFITNDIILDNKKRQIAIITGPNMAGKSTFLRQIGLIAVLGQIGSYVPADEAYLSIADQLFTRVGASDNLAGGESTFLVEMNETANILNNATSKSLIILDEIGRGTSTYDGLSLAWAITEYLHNNIKIKAKSLFATHYHELITLAEDLPDAFNLNVTVDECNGDIVFLRKIREGGASKSYGINVAKMAGIPSYVLNRANDLLIEFMQQKQDINSIEKESAKQIDIFTETNNLIDALKKINLETITPLEALNKLNVLKKKIK